MERNENCWYKDVCLEENCTNCIRYIEMKYLMDNSNLPKAKQQVIKLNIKPEDSDFAIYKELNGIKTNIVDFVESGKNLLLCGKYGTGKTSWAIKLLHKYFDVIWDGNGLRKRGLFIHVPTLISQLKDFSNINLTQLKNDIMKVDLVIWDEVNVISEKSAFDYNNLLVLLENRLLDEKANIYTSNLVTPEEWNKHLGERLTNRIFLNSKVIEFTGTNKRGYIE